MGEACRSILFFTQPDEPEEMGKHVKLKLYGPVDFFMLNTQFR